MASDRSAGRLCWVDLETTGLDPGRDAVLEVACVITTADLDEVARWQTVVRPPAHMPTLCDQVRSMHTRSGLLDALAGGAPFDAAAGGLLDFLRAHLPEGAVPLAGSSVHFDRAFMRQRLPDAEAWLHYRNVDVSTVKELVRRWAPTLLDEVPADEVAHRAMPDVLASIAELDRYRAALFLPGSPSGPRAINLVRDLHEAVHGAVWARPESPADVWGQLLGEVRAARRPGLPPPPPADLDDGFEPDGAEVRIADRLDREAAFDDRAGDVWGL